MKRLYGITVLLMLMAMGAQGQTWKEWLKQKRTQKEYLVTQIAANQIYLELLKKGYRIAKTGMKVVSSLKQGEFTLHEDFFGSLYRVSPIVRRYGKITETIAMQISIYQQQKSIKNKILSSSYIPIQEKKQVDYLLDQLLKKSNQTMNQTLDLLTQGNFAMDDQARLELLKSSHQEMRAHLLAIQSLANDLNFLLSNRAQEDRTIETMKKLYLEK